MAMRCIISTSPRLEAGTRERLWATNRLLRHGSTGLAGGCLGGSQISGASTFFGTHLVKLLRQRATEVSLTDRVDLPRQHSEHVCIRRGLGWTESRRTAHLILRRRVSS